jgi:signal transduction histidine kinase
MDVVVNVVPYVALVVATGLAWIASAFLVRSSVPVMLGLSGFAALWMLWFVTLHPSWRENRALMGMYFVVLLATIAALVLLNPLYGFFSFAGYLHAVYALRGRSIFLGVAGTAVTAALSQVGGVATLGSLIGLALFAVVMIFNVALASAMTALSWVSQEQATRRKLMITELAAANDKLEAAMAENAGLHRQLLTQAREAGILDERQRLAREIHDTIAQGLTGIVTQLEAAGSPGGDWNRHVYTATKLARDSLTEARRSVHALRPQPLEDAGLADALSGIVCDWSTTNGVGAVLTTTGAAQPLIPEIEATLLRAAQEALANVARHAAASRVGLTLSYMEDLVTLDVRDDGRGFDPGSVAAGSAGGGFGLTGMRERVHRIAGTLAVESEPGTGTAISVCVPAIPLGGTS